MFLSEKNKALISLCRIGVDEAREVFRRYFVSITKDKSGLLKSLMADGCEDVTGAVFSGQQIHNGVPVLWFASRAYALRPEVYAERLAATIEDAKKRQSEQQVAPADVKEGLAETTCPQMIEGKPCGGALNRRGVCPSCVTGRMGYRYRYTCESCGCDIVTREELR